MKVQVLLPVTVIVSVALLGLIKIRKKEEDREDRRKRFLDIKLRVTYDMLGEFEKEMSETQKLLYETENGQKTLEEEVNVLQTKADKTKGDADVCQGGQKTARDELASAETEFNNFKAETDKETATWKIEVENLKQQLATRNPVCDFLKKGSDSASKLCGNEQPKAEAPKQEEVKAEAPKQEEAKPEAPKQEEAKPEAPKQEEAKAEAPKKR
ncbi:FK506-binding protein 3-like [Seriola dumerili]|uniref:Zgc:174935 n=1 Tax=Seriola dumerili TaxID=41447 RepID=A0A3B4T9W6_SERDU|nr:FK506-binding protein 3-like [Seriola dumerili]